MTVMLSSLLKIEKLLKCNICFSTLRQARLLSNCGHRFCFDCISVHVENLGTCPTCELPTTLEDLKQVPMHDNLVSYVNKLKTALLKHSLTPLEESLRRREEEASSSDRKRTAVDMINTQESEDLEEEYRDDPKRFKSSSSEFIDELLSDRPVRNRKAPPPSYVIDMDLDEDPMEMSVAASTPSLVGAPVGKQPAILVPDIAMKWKDDDEDNREEGEEEEDGSQSQQIKSPSPAPQRRQARKAKTPEPTETSNNTWDCAECQYKNKSYMQICGICKKSKNRKVRPPTTGIATRTRRHSEQQSTMGATVPEQSLESATVAPSRPKRRQQTEDEKREVHIIQTSLSEEDSDMMEKMSEKIAETTLKVTIHTELKYFDDITHVISSVNKKGQCHRTLKYLHGLLLGKWIVSPQWYMDSIKAKKWLPEKDYEVQGDAKSGITHAPSRGRIEFADGERLFQDMNFYLVGDFPEKHSKKDIGILIQAGGGNAYNRKPAKSLGKSGKKVNTIDPSQPIVLCCPITKKKNLDLLNQFQVREPVWIVDCISNLRVE